MASQYPEEEDSSMFECAICLQDMLNRTPKALPCLHTFCMECIQVLPSNNNKITCPTCRKECDLSTKGVDHLPDNFHLQSFLQNKQQSNKNCFGCSTHGKVSKAINQCVECEIEMCKPCTDIHEMRLKGKHEILKLISAKSDKVRCEEHKSDNVKYYCKDCNEFVCPLCVLYGSHSAHNTFEINDFMKKPNESMPKFLQAIEEKLNHLNTLSREIKENLQKTKNVKESIETTAALLREQINEQESSLLQKCTEECEKPLNDACEFVERLKNILGDLKNECLSGPEKINKISIVGKISNWDKQMAKSQQITLNCPIFLAKKNVNLGDYSKTSVVRSFQNQQ